MASGYDPRKDEKLHVAPAIEGAKDTEILVGIFSYDGGPAKLRINRAATRQTGETRVGKLGGMTRQEARAVAQTVLAITQDDQFWSS